MSGYREFRPGQVWFYYNPNMSKELERRKELGALTSRPVVIVQSAYYPEWTDSVTVLPITSSDRRSGIHIDTTILHDGSIVEGGTILPYLFYTIKARYLHAMSSDQNPNKMQLVSLSDEDFDAVQQAMAYHLGFTKEVPAYVKQWKTLNDCERNTIIRQIHLVIDDFETKQRYTAKLRQEPDESPVCENHINAACNRISADRSQVFSGDGFEQRHVEEVDKESEGPIKLSQLTVTAAREWKKAHPLPSIIFRLMGVNGWATDIEPHMVIHDEDLSTSRIYPGSKVLENVPYNQIQTVLTQEELDQIAKMSSADVIECTGVKSSGTAYRVRRQAAKEPSVAEALAAPKTPPFMFDAKLNMRNGRRGRVKRLKLWKILFSLTENECKFLLRSDVRELESHFPTLAPSEIKQLKAEVCNMYPNRTLKISVNGRRPHEMSYKELKDELEADATKSTDAEFNTMYDLWETLAPTEIAEIASASKRNSATVAHKYGIVKSNFGNLRSTVIEVSKPNGKMKQPPIDDNRKEIACNKIIREDLTTVSSSDILIFCRTDYSQIVSLYGKCGSPNTPSKKDIAELKKNLRKIIVRKK